MGANLEPGEMSTPPPHRLPLTLSAANQDLFPRNCEKSFIFSGSAFKYSGFSFS